MGVTERTHRDWWKEYFDRDYILIEDIPSEEVNLKCADFIERVFNLPQGSKILDLGCGYGRFSIELVKRGYIVVGLDYSKNLLDMARVEAKKENLEVKFIQCDMREMTYQNEFDGVLSWSTSFGYFSDEENEKVMQSIASSLKKNGKLLLDLHNRDYYIRQVGRKWYDKVDLFILADWKFDINLSRLNIEYNLLDLKTGKVCRTMNSFREYSFVELKRMIKDSGLELIRVYGDCSIPFSLDSHTLQILARKK